MLPGTQHEVGIAEDGPVERLVGHVAEHILRELDQPGFNRLLLAFCVAAPLRYPFTADSLKGITYGFTFVVFCFVDDLSSTLCRDGFDSYHTE